MNVDIERGLKLRENQDQSEKEQFNQLLDLLGMFGGYNPSTFEEEKEAIINSGISLEDFRSILSENFSEKFGPRELVRIDIQLLNENAKIPTYAHITDACADIYASEKIIVNPGETVLVPTGIALAIPEGYVVHIYPRSSIGAKTPLRLSNSVGVIDSGYRDEVKIIYTNMSNEKYKIKKGDRIAQMSIDASPMAIFNAVKDVKEIGEDREGGIGSTGGLEVNEINEISEISEVNEISESTEA